MQPVRVYVRVASSLWRGGANNTFLNLYTFGVRFHIIRTGISKHFAMLTWTGFKYKEFIFMQNNVFLQLFNSIIQYVHRQSVSNELHGSQKYREQMAQVPCVQSGHEWQLVRGPSALRKSQVVQFLRVALLQNSLLKTLPPSKGGLLRTLRRGEQC